MKITFGKFAGQDLEMIDELYLIWLAKGTGYTDGKHSTEMRFKIPIPVWAEARRILESRGFKIIGERIERE